MDEEYYRQLVKRYLEGNSTDAELEVFAALIKEGKLDACMKEALNEEAGINPEDELTIARICKKRNLLPAWLKYTAAAALFLATFTSLYIRSKLPLQQTAKTKTLKNDALPGGSKAVLTLANGTKIVLNAIRNGKIASQGQTNINKVEDGYLRYQSSAGAELAATGSQNQETAYNTLSTPTGGEYQVTLPDGSKAWLNAVSSITFPIAFTGTERRVSITGEVYFEVAKNKNKPFSVNTRGQQVQVLGTHFNINAYDDEDKTRTTLLEGSIKITANHNSRIMIPGQQAEVRHKKIRIIENANAEAAVAWKNGYFVFDNADLPTLMRQLSRWYDVNIIYNGNAGDHEFVGEIKRSSNLSRVLKILALSGIHFKIENKNLFIQP
jgi:transmembrane sensor